MTLLILTVCAFFTASLTGVMGMGGGLVLISIMANFFSPSLLIPLHGFVQSCANTSRSLMSFRSIHWRTVFLYSIGAVIGATLGSRVLITLPEEIFRFVIGFSILGLVWMPKFKSAPKIPGKFFFVGVGATFLSLFIGATGPIVAPFFQREGFKKNELIATLGMTQAIQHAFKVVTFVMLGFNFLPYSTLLLSMVFMVILGSYFGKWLLGKVKDHHFEIAFKVVVSILALRMIVLGFLEAF